MLSLREYWRDINPKKRIGLLCTFGLMVFLIGLLFLASGRSRLTLLYSGLDQRQSGSVLAAVEASGTEFEVRGDSIWVDERNRDTLRMTLAGEGLPSQAGNGYEVLDGMSGFGTTSQMFDAAYWRAKEGELARTALTLPNIVSARVHLAVAQGRGARFKVKSSGSITLKTRGAGITRNQASALRFLVSSAVPGMSADQVTVIDSDRGLMSDVDGQDRVDRADEMKGNIERILDAHVGVGNGIVELNLELVTESEVITEQRFDPQQRALLSQEREELADQSSNVIPKPVTASSNLPEPTTDAKNIQSTRSETRHRSNYEVSQLSREVNRQPGAIDRLTVAVLLNGIEEKIPSGEVRIVPRKDSDLDVIRELVAAAVGFDESRGDAITVKSLPFSSLSEIGTLVSQPPWVSRIDPNMLIWLSVVVVIIFSIIAFIIRPILNVPKRGFGEVALDAPNSLATGGLERPYTKFPTDTIGLQSKLDVLDIKPAPTDNEPIARLRGLMKENRSESLRLLSGWIDAQRGES